MEKIDSKEYYSFYEWDKIKVFDMLFRCKGNVLKILRNRGYEVTDEEYSEFEYSDYDEFKRKRDRCLRRIKRKHGDEPQPRKYLSDFYYKDDGTAVYVTFITEDKTSVSKNTIDNIVKKIDKNDVTHTIIISDSQIHKSLLDKYAETAHVFEVYQMSNMCVDRLNHVLSPKVEKLTRDEKKAFLSQGIPASKLPHYERWNRAEAETSEPLLQHFQYPVGTIVKIVRENNYTKQLADESLYWRVVG